MHPRSLNHHLQHMYPSSLSSQLPRLHTLILTRSAVASSITLHHFIRTTHRRTMATAATMTPVATHAPSPTMASFPKTSRPPTPVPAAASKLSFTPLQTSPQADPKYFTEFGRQVHGFDPATKTDAQMDEIIEALYKVSHWPHGMGMHLHSSPTTDPPSPPPPTSMASCAAWERPRAPFRSDRISPRAS